jgi:hypothetical protein
MLNHQQQDYMRYFFYCNTQAPSRTGKLTGDLELAYLKLEVMFWSVRLEITAISTPLSVNVFLILKKNHISATQNLS